MSTVSNIPICKIEEIFQKNGERHPSMARIRMNNTGVSLKLTVAELLDADWIGKFSAHDIVLLAVINASEWRMRDIILNRIKKLCRNKT